MTKDYYKSKRTCTFPGCGRPHNAKGYCAGHCHMILNSKELIPIRTGLRGTNPAKGCSVEGCKNIFRARGYCSTHYQSLIVKKDHPLKPRNKIGMPCIIKECTGLSRAKGLCAKHYVRARYVPSTTPKLIRLCTIENCNEKHKGHGFCSNHYTKFFTSSGKKRKPRAPFVRQVCDVDNCESFARARGYCDKHYTRFMKHGNVHANYANNHKRTKYNMNKTPLNFTHSHEEVLIINEFFDEMVGLSNPMERYD